MDACQQCRKPFPVHPPGYCGGTGYAVLTDGSRVCYACADKWQLERLKDRSSPVIAYLQGGDITTWTGGKLMKVVSSRHTRNGERSIRARDYHGGCWAGRGSNGMAIKLRPVIG